MLASALAWFLGHSFKFYVKVFFYVMGKELSHKLSCRWTDLIFFTVSIYPTLGKCILKLFTNSADSDQSIHYETGQVHISMPYSVRN